MKEEHLMNSYYISHELEDEIKESNLPLPKEASSTGTLCLSEATQAKQPALVLMR